MQVNANVNVEAVEANTTTNAVYGHDPSWQTIIDWPDYEINVQYPYDIRCKDTGRVVKKYIHQATGYWHITLNGKPYRLHRLIAQQFINNPNPQEFTVVDHINRNKLDYHISNLRWTSQSENCKNKSSNMGVVYRYLDEIDENCIVISTYGNRTLENYYYDQDLETFYWHDTELDRYREIPVLTQKSGCRYVWTYDTAGKRVQICLKKFKSLYGLD